MFPIPAAGSKSSRTSSVQSMWRPWGRSRTKSTLQIRDSSFSCSSFKDIQNLCTEEDYSAAAAALKKAPTVFHRISSYKYPLRSRPDPNPQPGYPCVAIPGSDKRIVVYFTSLRVVRSTFEDCKAVRSILRGFRVEMDERDLAMNSGFLSELEAVLGQSKSKLTLPKVFIGGRYIGGADEVLQLHETGKLNKLMEGLPPADPVVCEACGGYGFVLCRYCNGSRRIYSRKSGFKSCTVCNENGLIRCPSCSCAPM